MKIRLEIETHDRHLGFDIAGINNTLTIGATVNVPGGAKISFQGSDLHKSLDNPEVLQFILEIAKDVEVGLLIAWLLEKVSGKPVKRMIINRRTIVDISEQGIRLVFEEEIHSSE